MQKFVTEYLEPRLNPTELNELRQAYGRWPNYGKAILKLAEQHPRYPSLPSGQVKDEFQLLEILRPAAQKPLLHGQQLGSLRNLKGKWPEFALLAVELIRKKDRKIVLPPLGASKLSEFPREMQDFINTQLIPELKKTDAGDNDQKLMTSLKVLEGHWPKYPRRLLQLAERYNLVIPGMSIPGPPALWRSVKSGVP